MIRGYCKTENCRMQFKTVRFDPGKIGCDLCGNNLVVQDPHDSRMHREAIELRAIANQKPGGADYDR